MGTVMHPIAQILLDQLATVGVGAHLGCVSGVDQYHRAPSLFRFVAGVLNQLCPGDIRDAFAHPTAFAHLLRLKFLKRDHLIAVDQFPAALVGKILAAKPDALVDATKRLLPMPVLVPLLRVFSCILQLLRSFEISLIASEKARVLDFFTIRSGQERLKPHIHTDYMRGRWQSSRLNLDRETDIPLVRARAFQANGLDLSLDRAMPHDLNSPDLGDDQVVPTDDYPVAILRVGDTSIAFELLVARVSSILCAFLYVTEEGLKRQIDP